MSTAPPSPTVRAQTSQRHRHGGNSLPYQNGLPVVLSGCYPSRIGSILTCILVIGRLWTNQKGAKGPLARHSCLILKLFCEGLVVDTLAQARPQTIYRLTKEQGGCGV